MRSFYNAIKKSFSTKQRGNKNLSELAESARLSGLLAIGLHQSLDLRSGHSELQQIFIGDVLELGRGMNLQLVDDDIEVVL